MADRFSYRQLLEDSIEIDLLLKDSEIPDEDKEELRYIWGSLKSRRESKFDAIVGVIKDCDKRIDQLDREIKDLKSIVGKKSKVNHLSYIGDSEIGKSVNIGAGTITCNYDGAKKSKTKIKDNVFIGSNSSLVAPITINKKSIVGAGSVITKNVKEKSLALTRSKQTEVKNYKRK